ncbi:allergen v5 tpx-1-related family related [Cystoisospora suis]|uniref:Allergen v5 tpx-1-related family related n=1 Tax=Cystoisospora suis TaxID=483139 RepID=A0A2C6KJG7_9APIC|nr:allergen v5 tpx-1-related family related [Cystoisospora suis]
MATLQILRWLPRKATGSCRRSSSVGVWHRSSRAAVGCQSLSPSAFHRMSDGVQGWPLHSLLLVGILLGCFPCLIPIYGATSLGSYAVDGASNGSSASSQRRADIGGFRGTSHSSFFSALDTSSDFPSLSSGADPPPTVSLDVANSRYVRVLTDPRVAAGGETAQMSTQDNFSADSRLSSENSSDTASRFVGRRRQEREHASRPHSFISMSVRRWFRPVVSDFLYSTTPRIFFDVVSLPAPPTRTVFAPLPYESGSGRDKSEMPGGSAGTVEATEPATELKTWANEPRLRQQGDEKDFSLLQTRLHTLSRRMAGQHGRKVARLVQQRLDAPVRTPVNGTPTRDKGHPQSAPQQADTPSPAAAAGTPQEFTRGLLSLALAINRRDPPAAVQAAAARLRDFVEAPQKSGELLCNVKGFRRVSLFNAITAGLGKEPVLPCGAVGIQGLSRPPGASPAPVPGQDAKPFTRAVASKRAIAPLPAMPREFPKPSDIFPRPKVPEDQPPETRAAALRRAKEKEKREQEEKEREKRVEEQEQAKSEVLRKLEALRRERQERERKSREEREQEREKREKEKKEQEDKEKERKEEVGRKRERSKKEKERKEKEDKEKEREKEKERKEKEDKEKERKEEVGRKRERSKKEKERKEKEDKEKEREEMEKEKKEKEDKEKERKEEVGRKRERSKKEKERKEKEDKEKEREEMEKERKEKEDKEKEREKEKERMEKEDKEKERKEEVGRKRERSKREKEREKKEKERKEKEDREKERARKEREEMEKEREMRDKKRMELRQRLDAMKREREERERRGKQDKERKEKEERERKERREKEERERKEREKKNEEQKALERKMRERLAALKREREEKERKDQEEKERERREKEKKEEQKERRGKKEKDKSGKEEEEEALPAHAETKSLEISESVKKLSGFDAWLKKKDDYGHSYQRALAGMKVPTKHATKGNCPIYRTPPSPCTATCGDGERLQVDRNVKGNSCTITWIRSACIEVEGCPSGLETARDVLQLHPRQGLTLAMLRELGEKVMKAKWLLRKSGESYCETFEQVWTDTAFDLEGRPIKECGFGHHVGLERERTVDGVCLLKLDKRPFHKFCPVSETRFRKNMVDRHAELRSLAGVSALKWNQQLADHMRTHLKALETSQNCAMAHSSSSFRKNVAGYSYLGENLFHSCANGQLPEDVVDKWFSEVGCYRYGEVGNSCSADKMESCDARYHAFGVMTGHFTQVVSNTSVEVGCAYKVCERHLCGDGSSRPLLLVGCMYGPGGNIVGQYPLTMEQAKKLGEHFPNVMKIAPPMSDKESQKRCSEKQDRWKQENPEGHLGSSETFEKRKKFALIQIGAAVSPLTG